MTLKSVTEGTQPKKSQMPSQPIIPQPRPVAEVRTRAMYIYIVTFFLLTRRIIYGFWIICPIGYASGGITINYYNRSLTAITLKIFTINHSTKSHWNTLYTVLILHRVISCILTCALLAASLIHLLTTWLVLATLTVELNSATVELNWSRIFPESRYMASAPTAQKTHLYCWLAQAAQKMTHGCYCCVAMSEAGEACLLFLLLRALHSNQL
jgi:hypothetical protein